MYRFLSLFVLGLMLAYCTPTEEEITFDPDAFLTFSTDTVFFDTLFTDTVSFTNRFRVYNPQKNAVSLSSISLGQGDNSGYKLSVNGIKDSSFEDIIILGEDSLLVLVEVTIPSRGENTPFLVEDSVVFVTNDNIQSVNLVAWGQDAHFFRDDSVIACNTSWIADKPYVLYGSVLIDAQCELQIEPGVEIFVNKGASMFVAGTLKSVGTVEQPITFRNIRKDIENAPGQWTGILFLEGSKDNRMDHVTIRNAEFGVRLGTPDDDIIPDLVMSNAVIENMSTYGILCFTSDLVAYNVLVNNCVEATAGHFAGGHYTYQHCTFANYALGLFNEGPAVIFSDNLELADGSLLQADLYTQVQNSIVWGDYEEVEELQFSATEGTLVEILLEHSLIRSENPDYAINNNILATDPSFPAFQDPSSYNYQLDTLSPAKDQGTQLGIPLDLLGNNRDDAPDPGAYERIE